jgi:hypothetical protein
MLKLLIAATLFSLPGFSSIDGLEPSPTENLKNDVDAFFFTKAAFDSLLENQPYAAIENLKKAKSKISNLDPDAYNSWILIYLGQIIAYDLIGNRELCENSIGGLILLIMEFNEDPSSSWEPSSNWDIASISDISSDWDSSSSWETSSTWESASSSDTAPISETSSTWDTPSIDLPNLSPQENSAKISLLKQLYEKAPSASVQKLFFELSDFFEASIDLLFD